MSRTNQRRISGLSFILFFVCSATIARFTQSFGFIGGIDFHDWAINDAHLAITGGRNWRNVFLVELAAAAAM